MNIKLTKNALDALNASSSCAQQLGHDHVGSEHIFLSILAIPNSSAVKILSILGFSPEDLASSLRATISSSGANVLQEGQLPMTARTKKVLEMAAMDAGSGNAVGTAGLVLAMLREGDNAAAQLLFNAGVTVEKFLAAATQGSNSEKKPNAEASSNSSADEKKRDVDGENGKKQKTPTVNAFGRDLTLLARQGKLDPVIGRAKELKRVIQILSRRTKNNAVLIGEAGVGKTAVAEALAQAIHRGEVPERMQHKRVVALDMVRIVAGTQYRGQFEERIKKIIDETSRAGNIILFLDEIHTMVGAGGSEGAMDAANILKPALARGELQCVGATTLKEYHKSIEKDAALERRFQSVQIDAPSVADTIEILSGISSKYEEHHGVKFTPESIKAAAILTERYLPARQLPDKAIDAIDETGARIRAQHSVRPDNLTKIQARIDTLRGKKDAVVSEGDFDSAAKYRDEIRELSAKFADELKAWRSAHLEEIVEISDGDIAETVSAMSGVPVEKMSDATAEKLLGMEKSLSEAVIGQQEAIKAISRALRRSRAFAADPKRPIGSFLFLGPTGVGKTYLAKMLAERVYGDEKSLITLDMSEFQEKYSSSRLVGSPPGYVGYDEGGQLTEKVRRRPYSVVLFDEFEKANGDVMNMLLQILDEGRLTDGQGRVIDFRNTIVICTANLGFDFTLNGRSMGFAPETAENNHELLKEKLLAESKRTFRPELLNRFDETVVFSALDKEAVAGILKLELSKLAERVEGAGVKFRIDKKAIEFLVEKGYDSKLGARPLRRVIQKYIEDPLAEIVLSNKVKTKLSIKLSKSGDELKII